MIINGIDYKVAPCPLCGSIKRIYVFTKGGYTELFKENGHAAIDMECMNCYIQLWEMNDEIKDYDEKVAALLKKWNRLCGGEKYADTKD